MLKSVLFEFVQKGPDGKEQVYQTILLRNALIVRYRAYTPEGIPSRGAQAGSDELEDVSMRFQSIEIENKLGKTSATADWHPEARREAP